MCVFVAQQLRKQLSKPLTNRQKHLATLKAQGDLV